MSWVQIQDFSYTYPGEQQPALKEINLSLEQGEFAVIAGPSGSGKSTLGKALAGFLFQDEPPKYTGKVIVNQTDMTRVPLYQTSERVTYVQQNPEDQFCTLSVLDEIAFGLENACLDPDEIEVHIDQALETVKGLNLRGRLLATLSGGEKQKVAIASMLALLPDVLILDEPTSNLDPDATQHVFETFQALRDQANLTVIVIEHKLSQLRAFNPKVFLIESGRIVTETCLHEFSQSPISGMNEEMPTLHRVEVLDERPILDVSQLEVRIDDREILQDISFRVYPGEFVAIMGPNGSGKSTLLNTLIGLQPSQNGTLTGCDQDLTQAKTSALVSDMGFIFQNPDHQLFTQSVWDEATLTIKSLAMLDDENIQKAHDLLSEIGLSDRLNDHPQRLSYGEKRRLNLVSAILHNPQLLLIDEFLIGQDMANAHKWMRILKDMTAKGRAILLVNHHALLTQMYCDRLIFLDGGKLLIDAPVIAAFDHLAEKGFKNYLPVEDEVLAYA